MTGHRKRYCWISVFYFTTGLICTTMLLWACSSPMLEEALQVAGKNRAEMERVLDYFSQSSKDSLKYWSARFLIENMPGHTTYLNNPYDEHFSTVKQNTLLDEMHKTMAELVTVRFIDSNNNHLVEDIESLSSDFLIQHIESVFRRKDSCAWLKDIDFEDFCEYLLPYRVGKEYTLLPRDSLLYIPTVDDYISLFDNVRNNLGEIGKYLNSKTPLSIYEIKKFLPLQLRKYTHDCRDEALINLLTMRQYGIPAALDMIPSWGNFDGGHVWAQPIEREFDNRNFVEAFSRTIPKVYRNTYTRLRNYPIETATESIPDFFRNPYLKDVTHEYVNTTSVKKKGFPATVHNAYLCVFNQHEWKPVAWASVKGGECTFLNMGRNVLYLPAYYQGANLVPASSPFIINKSGKVIDIQIDDEARRNVCLFRKSPLEKRLENLIRPLDNFIIEASENIHFLPCDTIAIANRCNPKLPFVVMLSQHYNLFRIRLEKAAVIVLAEINCYDKHGKSLKCEIENKDIFNGRLVDGDVLTSAWVRNELKFAVHSTDTVASITLLSANDGNGVYPGDEYELLYWDSSQQWVSCGRKIADDYRIVYEQVPTGCLFWLCNLTEGKEERIFTYEDGKQYFW